MAAIRRPTFRHWLPIHREIFGYEPNNRVRLGSEMAKITPQRVEYRDRSSARGCASRPSGRPEGGEVRSERCEMFQPPRSWRRCNPPLDVALSLWGAARGVRPRPLPIKSHRPGRPPLPFLSAKLAGENGGAALFRGHLASGSQSAQVFGCGRSSFR
jgi:hypothetical protein